MELLLLLSALLSTLTGAISGARAPEVQLQQSRIQAVAAAPLAVARHVVQVRPAQPILRLAGLAGLPAGVADWSLSSAIPLYADRLRE